MGLFGCVGGANEPSKKALIVDLERKQVEVTNALAKAQAHEQERQTWALLRAQMEVSLQAKDACMMRLLTRCCEQLEGETDASDSGKQRGEASDTTVNVAVTAYEPDKIIPDAEHKALVLHLSYNPEASKRAHAATPGTGQGGASTVESRLEAAVSKLLDSKVQSAQLLAAHSTMQAGREQAKIQQAVLEQQCIALETENQALSGLNGELQGQLERLISINHESTASMQAELQALQQDLADRDRQMADLQASSLMSRDAELQALAAGRSEAVANLGTVRRQLATAQAEVETLRRSLLSREQEVAALTEAKAATTASLEDAQWQLAVLRTQLSNTEALLVANQERAQLAEDNAAALGADLQSTQVALAEAQQKVSQKSMELSTMLRALNEVQERTAECEKSMAAAKAVAEASERSLQDMTEQYVAAKRDLMVVSKQAATVVQEHTGTLDKLTSSSSQLEASRQMVQNLEAQLQTSRQEATSAAQRLRELEACCPALETELLSLRSTHRLAMQDLERLQALLRGISRLSSKAGGLVPGQGQELDAASLTAFYDATVKEDCLRLKLCDMPLALCGPLFNAVADSRQLSSLVLDMDSSRETLWEKVGLRVGCLAAALGVNSSLRSVELSGWTWSEVGNGCALPFLTLGSLSGLTNLCTVKVDTKLFDVDCAAALTELLHCGLVQLKRPGGQGVLRLYSDNEDLDEWYGTMIQDAVEPVWQQHRHRADQQRPSMPRSASMTPASTPLAVRNGSLSVASMASTAMYAGAGLSPAVRAALAAPAVVCQTPSPRGAAGVAPVDSPSAAGTPMMSPGRAGVELMLPDVPDALTDLSNKGLESHHMVVVMAVLLCCPHLKRLRLDGNKLGNSGAELLSLGLVHNNTLRELLLSRNSITAPGARRLARSLERNSGLRRLDLSAQRFEGLGAAGAEAIVASLRHNSTLEELSLSSNSLGSAAAASLCAILRLGAQGSALKRLGAGHNGFDSAAAKALQEVAAERGLVVTV